jgi:hypothetical protein
VFRRCAEILFPRRKNHHRIFRNRPANFFCRSAIRNQFRKFFAPIIAAVFLFSVFAERRSESTKRFFCASPRRSGSSFAKGEEIPNCDYEDFLVESTKMFLFSLF